ncbi:RagB/SusD family nutrient uptake outer membrane protein [Rhodocytophaga aerolata]|uniref:RagB/SusD family nutrient uptake outer membrane protein n=1 Tax=Rhodocytophaga aerolata TaxID=455078 RepID=A0ABT8RD32_9BACT|nr:RagB/SusD family nutrient uptake outer membrane protein [Rhodocytophaga aerolata]MDO1449138.1 RagB/SusD family nutrient uptake outer membrane protein [Rhodocytophaga aerolata]
MKNSITIVAIFLLAGAALVACKDSFLDEPPRGTFSESILKNRAGVEGILVGAYSLLDGVGGPSGNWEAAGSNWVFGDVASDDAYKGTDAGDQIEINPIERYEPLPTNGYFNLKWRHQYDGVSRSNDVLRLLPEATDIPDAEKLRITAEARFLRGYYHFDAKRMWNMVPYVDEKTIIFTDFTTANVPNNTDIWPRIEEDIKFAYDNLPETQAQVGRVNKWAAGAYLGKVYMYQKKFAEAKQVFDNVIANGTTSAGKKYALNPQYHDNFRVSGNNSAESVLAAQTSVNDGANGLNANWGDILNFTYGGGPGGCCGFHQPSQNLVNAHKTDANGLPLLDTFNEVDVKNDQGILATQPFDPYAGNLDPRLDWSVGRRGIPHLDWGNHPGVTWIRDQVYGGPYSPKKNHYYQADIGKNTDGGSWTQGLTNININLMRFADVLLMAAEAEVELGNLEAARTYVNRIRERAQNPEGFVKRADGTAAATYVIGTYTTPWIDAATARKAVRFERRLELAMEGHRFFDLVRWGIAAETLNTYLAKERTLRQYLVGATFKPGVNEYFPIPEQQIVLSTQGGQPTLQQNPGY